MSELKIIKCQNCGKVLCEANGEVKKVCPKCKTMNHVIINESGMFYVGVDLASGPYKTVYHYHKK